MTAIWVESSHHFLSLVTNTMVTNTNKENKSLQGGHKQQWTPNRSKYSLLSLTHTSWSVDFLSSLSVSFASPADLHPLQHIAVKGTIRYAGFIFCLVVLHNGCALILSLMCLRFLSPVGIQGGSLILSNIACHRKENFHLCICNSNGNMVQAHKM